MLMTFRCKASANVTMFGSIGLQMLTMMGHSETVPGAILAKDVPEALRLLQAAIELEKKKAQPEMDDEDNESAIELPVSIANRALPLIALLKAASQEECDVMWEEGY
ncbi:DUF1840 domain-containing protein [Vibrio fluvialis]|uniref:DUF1840 domain-containing protein n=1 Tax=Vibrio fluvialis TaxID=676 RepID=UPI00192A7DA4|nr:DUF1840 domain-containing protein [Vibrio fluvialis]EKO3518029.1 DUF1840 domain-containing protein [Vibrio fluvialis]MBL4237026.1 DUF1840 domain-containing protein [Vibrio fluvialis]MBL4266764.1 DUF1840 domain-containing protein [Vibrio fluvialis]MBL4270214.1 DUF1840 domain-containing protein [Vibrio fluvialis]MBL4273665.1 DUF1840 domain-containing protein [Vibrio fluvialis]